MPSPEPPSEQSSIGAPQLAWHEEGLESVQFQDQYFSRQGGLAEARAVFLAGCNLPAAWASGGIFRVGELGFGTGLNALALWQCWRDHRPPGGRLVMASLEAFPLSRKDAARAHSAFPELAPLSVQMLAQWPAATPGAHLLDFPADGFRITVVHDEAAEALRQMEGPFDCWFLDGFAPSRNPAMWHPDLLARIASLSAAGARAATFTVAGPVRRGLASAGFTVQKMPGYGRKKERLEAELTAALPASPLGHPLPRGKATCGRILILGGGIAGAALAHALGNRGREVLIVHDGREASTPPAALLTPWLEAAHPPHARALFSAFLHAANLYQSLDGFSSRGGTRLNIGSVRARKLARLWPEPEADGDSLIIDAAGVLRPAHILNALSAGGHRVRAHVAAIRRDAGAWHLLDRDGQSIADAPTLILAGGAAASHLPLLSPLGLSINAGQLSVHQSSAPPARLLTWGGFVAPFGSDVLVGSSHEPVTEPRPLPPEPDLARRLAMDAGRISGQAIATDPVAIWTGIRAVTADHLPIAGPVPDALVYRRRFATHAKGGPVPDTDDDSHSAGLYTLTGLGSRGFAHAPLLAQQIAAELCGEPSILEASGRLAFHPARFLWRLLKRE